MENHQALVEVLVKQQSINSAIRFEVSIGNLKGFRSKVSKCNLKESSEISPYAAGLMRMDTSKSAPVEMTKRGSRYQLPFKSNPFPFLSFFLVNLFIQQVFNGIINLVKLNIMFSKPGL